MPAIVGGLAAVSGLAAVLSWSLSDGQRLTGTAVLFVAFVAVGDLLEVPLQRDAVFSLALAPALAYALLGSCVGESARACDATVGGQIGQTAAVFVGGITIALVLRLARNRPLRLPVVAARLLVVLGGTLSYAWLATLTPTGMTFGPSSISVFGLAAMLVAVIVLDVVLQSSSMLTEEERPFTSVLLDQARATGALLLSSISVAALLALSYSDLRAWTLPLFMAPLAATQYSFSQVAKIRRNYLQTVGALAKVPEMAGYTVTGHSRRVADLSTAMAKELGIVDPELHEIEYAALLHDIGRISLPDPDEASRSTSNLQLALVGAEIIEETGHLPTVATMVRDQHEPYRRRGEDTNHTLGFGAKIIKVASAFDDAVEPPGPGRTPREAVERLYLGMAYDYDPQVIQALTRVLERQGDI